MTNKLSTFFDCHADLNETRGNECLCASKQLQTPRVCVITIQNSIYFVQKNAIFTS